MHLGQPVATWAPPGPGTDRVDVFTCSGAANRPAAMPRCCLPVSGSSASSTCKPTCNFQSEVLLCDPNGPNTCGGASCRHFTGMTLPPTWGYCN